jgi:GWxTD domain-containing protein
LTWHCSEEPAIHFSNHGRRFVMKKFVFLAVLAGAVGANLRAQNLDPTASFVLNLDYARFRLDDQTSYLEIYYAFYPNLLTYSSSANGYRGGVKLWTRMKDNATNAWQVNQRTTLPVTISDTSSAAYRYPFTTQAGYALPFAEYTLEVVAVDSLDLSRGDSISLKVDLQAYPDQVAISDLELCSLLQPSSNKNDPFFKNSLEVVPNPTLVFGVATHPVLFNYAELYNLNPEATYTVKSQIVSPDGKVIKESSKPRKYGVKNGVEAGMMNVTAVIPGRYIFRLVVMDQSANELVQAEKTFYVYNPHLRPPAAAAAAFDAGQLSGLSASELDKEFRQARHVATDAEIKMFSQIQTENGMREFLARFWTEVEAGRLDQPPIKRTEYLRRVAAANQLYTAFGKDGWRTDRGRVLIIYGEPDQVDRVPSESESKPYQIWYYNRFEGGVQFVFVDRFGNGDYQLVHSTKRGEFRDDAWERFLR